MCKAEFEVGSLTKQFTALSSGSSFLQAAAKPGRTTSRNLLTNLQVICALDPEPGRLPQLGRFSAERDLEQISGATYEQLMKAASSHPRDERFWVCTPEAVISHGAAARSARLQFICAMQRWRRENYASISYDHHAAAK